jgi:hypothetical protein
MGELQVSESVVCGLAKALRSAGDETNSGLTSVDGELARLLGSGWTTATKRWVFAMTRSTY